tara:strand:+ start:456 stop:587 length:132 start_codon:yes stop_codon:yes gene_type:complete
MGDDLIKSTKPIKLVNTKFLKYIKANTKFDEINKVNTTFIINN